MTEIFGRLRLMEPEVDTLPLLEKLSACQSFPLCFGTGTDDGKRLSKGARPL